MILQESRSNPPLNLRYTNEPQFFDGSGDYVYRSLPTSQFFTPNATVESRTGSYHLARSQPTAQPWDARNWKDGRSQNWHLTLEREIMRDTAVRLSYIGNHGRDLEQRTEPQYSGGRVQLCRQNRTVAAQQPEPVTREPELELHRWQQLH